MHHWAVDVLRELLIIMDQSIETLAPLGSKDRSGDLTRVTKGKPLLPKMVKMAAEEMMLQRMRLKT